MEASPANEGFGLMDLLDHATRFTFTVPRPGHFPTPCDEIYVERRHPTEDQWVIRDASGFCLNRDGTWEFGRRHLMGRAYVQRTRFTRDEAVRLARQAAAQESTERSGA